MMQRMSSPKAIVLRCSCLEFFVRDKEHDGPLAYCDKCFKIRMKIAKLKDIDDIPKLFGSNVKLNQIKISELIYLFKSIEC